MVILPPTKPALIASLHAQTALLSKELASSELSAQVVEVRVANQSERNSLFAQLAKLSQQLASPTKTAEKSSAQPPTSPLFSNTATDSDAKTTAAKNPPRQSKNEFSSLPQPLKNYLQQLQRLQQAPLIYLIKVKTQTTQMLLFSDKAVATGSQIPLRLGANGQFVHSNSELVKPAAATNAEPLLSARATAAPYANSKLTHSLQQSLQQSIQQPLPTKTDSSQLQQALRQILPLQQPLPQLLSELQQLSQTLDIKHPAGALIKHLLNSWSLNPSQPQQTVKTLQNSALQFEQKLAQQLTKSSKSVQQVATSSAETLPTALLTDPKLILWALQSVIAGATSPKPQSAVEMLLRSLGLLLPHSQKERAKLSDQQQQQVAKTVKQTLAKLIFSQLTMATAQQQSGGDERLLLALELPLKHEQQLLPMQLQISREWEPEDEHKHADEQQQKSKDKTPCWQVNLSFSVPELGNIDAQCRYASEQLSCSLWAESDVTFTLLQQQISQLADKLEARGLQLGKMQCHRGRSQQPSNNIQTQLLDTHA